MIVNQGPDTGYASSVLVIDLADPPPFTATEGTTYLLQYRETPAELGIVPGFVANGSGESGPEPLRGYARADSGWTLLSPATPPLLTLAIFHPRGACDRVVGASDGRLLWSDEILRGIETEGGRRLVADRSGNLYSLEPDDRLALIGPTGAAAVAIASDDGGRSVLIFDDHGRLHRWDVATSSRSLIIADGSSLETPADTSMPVASMLVTPSGEIHVSATATPTSSTGPSAGRVFHRTAVAREGRWERWPSDDCPGDQNNEVTQSNRLAVADNGDIIAVGGCDESLLRRSSNGVTTELLPGLDGGSPFVVRNIRGHIHVGTRRGKVFEERNGPGAGWTEIIGAGGGTVDDLAPFGDHGLLIAIRFVGFGNNLQVWFPAPGTSAACSTQVRFTSVTTHLSNRGNHVLSISVLPNAGRRFELRLQ